MDMHAARRIKKLTHDHEAFVKLSLKVVQRYVVGDVLIRAFNLSCNFMQTSKAKHSGNIQKKTQPHIVDKRQHQDWNDHEVDHAKKQCAEWERKRNVSKKFTDTTRTQSNSVYTKAKNTHVSCACANGNGIDAIFLAWLYPAMPSEMN